MPRSIAARCMGVIYITTAQHLISGFMYPANMFDPSPAKYNQRSSNWRLAVAIDCIKHVIPSVFKPSKPPTLSMEDKSVTIKQRLQNYPTPATTWVDYFPSTIRPYFYLVRADRPAGTLLLFYPCAWSVTMTYYARSVPIATAWTHVGFFLLASLVFRSAGCVINDMWDKNIDAAVSRTRTRPLAAGDLTRCQAFVFLILQLALGVWLFMQLNQYSTILGLSSLVLVVMYPAMKRVTNWPQAVLAMCFN
ncbi:UbiA prenyltransferase family-domain-containing protein [Suillus ampliporus]|nr:UbiA prenyltransferase family-domain-containing protein [Suillus ampliporus]